MFEPLKLLSQSVVDELVSDVPKNLERYRALDFADLSRSNGWAIQSSLASWNRDIAEELDPSGTTEAEIRNSLLVWKAFKGMTPALARDERVWARMCHIEFLAYARARWLNGGEKDENLIRIHFFASGTTGCRDDNAIGRLWWNAHVASIASPDDVELGLRRLLARANYRMQIIERANTGFREPLVRGIVRILGSEPWLDSDDEAIVYFMKEVNKRSGSIVFEAFDEARIDDHLKRCIEFAQSAR